MLGERDDVVVEEKPTSFFSSSSSPSLSLSLYGCVIIRLNVKRRSSFSFAAYGRGV